MKKSLVSVLCGFGLTLFVFAFISWFYNNKINEIQAQLLQVDNFSHSVQLHKDKIESIFNHKQQYDSIAKMFQNHVDKNKLELQLLKEKTQTTFNDDNALKLQISNKLNEINQFETQLYYHISKIGYKEYGHIGNMRSVIHQIEQKYPHFEERILSLRRHEKDYIMRNDEYYAMLLHKEITLWKKQKMYPIELDHYLHFFDSVRYSMRALSPNSNNRTHQQWATSIGEIQHSLRVNRRELIEKSYHLTKTSITVQTGLALISFLVLLIGSSYIIRTITTQVSRLQQSMSDFISSNYQSGDQMSYKLPKNEIGQISLHYLKMARKIKRDVKLLEDRVARRTQALEEKNVLLVKQHTEMMNSLSYAQKLQESLLVSKKQLEEYFNHAFIHYQPKDLVGGDFYWMKHYQENGQDHVLFAMADSTGHGVPGALLSVLGMNILDELFAVEIRQPNELLNKLRQLILRRFQSDEQRMDGMDIAIFNLNLQSQVLEFSGAQMPLWIIRNNEIIELQGDRVPIGFTYSKHAKFALHKINLEENDKLFVFSDGLVDQFGMISNKKMGKKQLRYNLENSTNLSTQKIFNKLKNQHNNWKGNGEQTDDCTFIILEPNRKKEEKKETNNQSLSTIQIG